MVADLIDQANQHWKLPLLHQMFDEVAVEEIASIPIRSAYATDQLVWTATTDGNYSVKSNYKNIISKIQETTNAQVASTSHQFSRKLWRRIWLLPVESKIRSFLWSACQNALATKANLLCRHIITDPICRLCDQGLPETLEHIFFFYSWTATIWNNPQLNISLSPYTIHRFDDWLTDRALNVRLLPRLELIAQVLWQIRCARNNWIFRRTPPDPAQVVADTISHDQVHQAILQSHPNAGTITIKTGQTWEPPPRGYLNLASPVAP